MKWEYDLAVIGSTDEAIYAAIKATKTKKRVALVLYDRLYQSNNLETIYRRSYHKFSSFLKEAKGEPFSLKEITPNWSNNRVWIEEVIKNISSRKSNAILATLGIDVIDSKAEFFLEPQLGIKTQKRDLIARTYLLALGSIANPPPIIGLTEINYLESGDLWQKDLNLLGEKIAIIGNDDRALEIAKILSNLNKKVILIAEDSTILPAEDREIVNLLQANLEAIGITFYTRIKIDQVKLIDNKKWMQVGNEAIEVDELIVLSSADSRLDPKIEDLNLEEVGVKTDSRGIKVDRKLQTNNPQIYAVGSILGGYNCDRIARYEVDLALKNILTPSRFFPARTNYIHLPITVETEPNLARVGMTEKQAREQFGTEIQIIRQYLPKSLAETIVDREPTFCKLILRNNREIIGVHLLGDQAKELSESIALAIKHKLKFEGDFFF
jgi:pyruvate/2-oxoglutarate dehydrogenase complex dihydrolipoamide dehydrogenase (E3) component